MGELKSLGRVVDKLVREKMISLHKDHVNAVKPGAPLTQEELNTCLLYTSCRQKNGSSSWRIITSST